MYISQVKTQYKQFRKARICQGDIFQNLFISIGSGGGTLHVEANLEYAVVLTQDCDLQQDFTERNVKPVSANNDKHLNTILICPAYSLEDFIVGSHIEGKTMGKFGPKDILKLRKNDVFKRYHYLAEDLDNDIPDLVLDFKHFLTAPRDMLYSDRKTGYVASINEIYREALSQRFANFLARIGLPDNSSS